jgi:hypothetical protein
MNEGLLLLLPGKCLAQRSKIMAGRTSTAAAACLRVGPEHTKLTLGVKNHDGLKFHGRRRQTER